MKKVVATIVALSMLVMTVPATADTGDSSASVEDRLEMFEDDLETIEVVDENALPAFLASIQDDLTVEMTSTVGEDAGCDATGESFAWAESGTPAAPCSFEVHTHGIHYTTVDCQDSCFVDALDWATFGFLFVACDEGSTAVVDWAEGIIYVLQGSCEGAFAGNPTAFASWDSLGNEKWTHADNAGDALLHLLV